MLPRSQSPSPWILGAVKGNSIVSFSHSDQLRSAPLEWNAIRKIIQSLCFFSGAERFDDFETSPAGKTDLSFSCDLHEFGGIERVGFAL